MKNFLILILCISAIKAEENLIEAALKPTIIYETIENKELQKNWELLFRKKTGDVEKVLSKCHQLSTPNLYTKLLASRLLYHGKPWSDIKRLDPVNAFIEMETRDIIIHDFILNDISNKKQPFINVLEKYLTKPRPTSIISSVLKTLYNLDEEKAIKIAINLLENKDKNKKTDMARIKIINFLFKKLPKKDLVKIEKHIDTIINQKSFIETNNLAKNHKYLNNKQKSLLLKKFLLNKSEKTNRQVEIVNLLQECEEVVLEENLKEIFNLFNKSERIIICAAATAVTKINKQCTNKKDQEKFIKLLKEKIKESNDLALTITLVSLLLEICTENVDESLGVNDHWKKLLDHRKNLR